MLAFAFYGFACFGIALVCTTLSTLLRPIRSRDDHASWRSLAFFFIVCLAAPYGYHAVLTRLYGSQVVPVAREKLSHTEFGGQFRYARVLGLRGDRARVLVVTTETDESWGGVDRPMATVKLRRSNGAWAADSYKIVSSARLNKEGWIFPPYR